MKRRTFSITDSSALTRSTARRQRLQMKSGSSASWSKSQLRRLAGAPFRRSIRDRGRSGRPDRAACRPTTIAWTISAWRVSIPSTFCGATLSPLSRTMMSFLRSVMTIRPCSSIWPTSPVWSQPSISGPRGLRLVAPIALHDQLAAHQDLAVLGDPDLGVLQRRADRVHLQARPRPVAADHRRRLGLAVALEQGEAERVEEDADLGIERRAARDHRLDPAAEAWPRSWAAASGRGTGPSACPTAAPSPDSPWRRCSSARPIR